MWTQEEAIALCREIEDICPNFGCHVALTGGLLYKTGPRKDCDLLFYRIRQVKEIDKDGLWDALYERLQFSEISGFGFVHKATYRQKPVDCFFPEEDGKYPILPEDAPRLSSGASPEATQQHEQKTDNTGARNDCGGNDSHGGR